ncbi:MAG: FdhF/YdeP family oxidoreductase [Pseudomonadota bacterium]
MSQNDEKSRNTRGTTDPSAGGWPALRSVGRYLVASGKPLRGAQTMLKANQPDGFDCPGCAWGDPEHGSSFEFCENGVKAVSWEATKERATPAFFAQHTLTELRTWSDHELEKQGRLTHPMRYDAESDCYAEVNWTDAFDAIGAALNALDDPNEAEFYTSGRASNEAAFLYQTFVRLYGTNNFPDCSHMCHEASGIALTEAIGVGKGTVQLADLEEADTIFVIGQNPGTNHPRMLSDLRSATVRGARVVVINPLKERGLRRFSDPQNKLEMLRAGSRPTSTDYFCPRSGGDMAVFRGMAKRIFARDASARQTGESAVLDDAFIAQHTSGIDAYRQRVANTDWTDIEDQAGLSRQDIETLADIYIDSERVIATWAMGLTQHEHAVDTIRELTSVMLLRGNIGRPGTGLCPVRGHSNVQGDRTVGIDETAPSTLLDAMEKELGTTLPRVPGHNVLETIGAMLSGRAKAFVALGGNFARAVPDSALIAHAMRRLELTVSIATKLNHCHLLTGKTAFLLPCLGRTELDANRDGVPQVVTVEDSMSMVHGSTGFNPPASDELKSEVNIVAGIAKATVGNGVVDWLALAHNHDRIRDMISRVLPIFGDYNANIRRPRGFKLRNPAAEREWQTSTQRANFHAAALPERTDWQRNDLTKREFVLQTIRSHDQYNTTVYSSNDRYRGVSGERNVIFANADDLRAIGAAADGRADLIGIGEDGVERIARGFKLLPYDIPRGCLAGYYPELNVLVPHQSYGAKSFTPTSKSIRVVLRLQDTHE